MSIRDVDRLVGRTRSFLGVYDETGLLRFLLAGPNARPGVFEMRKTIDRYRPATEWYSQPAAKSIRSTLRSTSCHSDV